jgi:hypothetical protein
MIQSERQALDRQLLEEREILDEVKSTIHLIDEECRRWHAC